MKRMGKNLGIVARINFFCIVLVATVCYAPNQLICSAGVLSSPSLTPPTTPTTSTGGGGGVSYKDRIIGCLYSDVCQEDQVCFDDHAFGRCEQYDPKTGTYTSDYIYELDRKTLQLLESEWQRLNHQGFYWSHPYTQCILKVILNDRPRSRYDPDKCEQYLSVDKHRGNIRRQSSDENFDEKNNAKQQQWQPKLLDQVSSVPAKSAIDDDNDLFMNIEQTLSKYLVPYDGPSPPFRKPQPIEKQQQQQRPQPRQHQNELNKESLPLISLFPPQAPPQAQPPPPPPPPAISVSSLSSSKKSSTPSSGKHIDMLRLFPTLFRNNNQHDDDDDGYNNDDDNLKSWENFDVDKNRELLDYLQDMINNNGNYNGGDGDDGRIDGLTEFPVTNDNDVNPDPQQEEKEEEEEEEEWQQGNYVPNKNLMKTTTSLFHVNDFTGGNSHEFQAEQEEFNDPQLIETLFHDTNIIGGGDHYGGDHYGDDRRRWKQARDQQQSSPLMSILKTIPEIRIIRDTEDNNMDLNPFDLTLIETSSTATVDDPNPQPDQVDHHQLDDPDPEDHVILLDLDDNDDHRSADDNDNNGGFTFRNPELEDLDLDYADLLLLNQILNGELIKDGLEHQEDAADDDHPGDDGHMMASGEDGQKQQEEDDDDEDDDDDRKEILIGDINYSNNYLLPNFYRNHRYDIKKPGPIFLEDYILENLSPSSKPDPDSDESSAMVQNGDLRSNQANNGGGMSADNVLTKKDFSIRSQQPVAEGPVKLDSASKDQLIIRTATMGEKTDLEAIDSTHAYVVIDQMLGEEDSGSFLQTIEQLFNLPRGTFSNLRKEDYQITFKVNPNYQELNASQVATRIEDSAKLIQDITGYAVKETGIGDKTKLPVVSARQWQQSNDQILRMTLLVTTIILSIISGAFVVYLFRRNVKFREKIKGFMKLSEDWIKFDYQDLCRQRFRNKTTDANNKNGSAASDSTVDVEKKESSNNKAADRSTAMKNVESGSQHGSQHDNQGTNPPSRSSTSSYVEEPVSTNMDITTGHIILSYMEDHLKRKDRLDQEWEALCTYEADPCSCNAAVQKQNTSKNRYPNVLPYDHSRVILNDGANVSHSDYINANTITDHDPRNPAYIATQGPLPNTKADFWQMIWEQGSVLIVMLTRLRENGLNMCERYWPEEGSEVYGNFEVHLVSEHIWCDDYLVRSFYLKNLKTTETRTVTQFHYLSWPEMGVPQSIKSVLDFRRKVNKSYKGRSCPIVVHCNDGVGRTGTYILIDMVLNRLAKGAKEIDLAASLEHIRDQRAGMVKTKQQFEFVLSSVADEVQAILKTLPN